MTEFFSGIIDSLAVWPWWAVAGACFLAALLEMVFPPVPGQFFIIAVGALMGVRGLGVMLTASAAFVLGTFLGGCIDFFVAQRMGKALLRKPLVLKLFPLRFQEKAHCTVSKYGEWAMLVAKFIPGIGALVVLLCGIMGMERRKAVAWLAAIAVLHTGLFIGFGLGLGRVIASLLTWDIRTALLMLGLLGLALGALWLFRKWVKP